LLINLHTVHMTYSRLSNYLFYIVYCLFL